MLGMSQNVQLHKVMSASVKPPGIQEYPAKYFVSFCLLKLADMGKKKKNTTDSKLGLITVKNYEKFSRLVPLWTWLQMVENDWDDLNSWYFFHWTGAKISWFYVHFAVLGYVWNGLIVVVTKDYLSRGSSKWACVSFSAVTLRTHPLLCCHCLTYGLTN